MQKELEKWGCEYCKTEWYMRPEDVKNKKSVEGIVCPFCATYGDHVARWAKGVFLSEQEKEGND